MTSNEYVAGADQVVRRDLGDGDYAYKPVGTFHAVRSAGVHTYGRAGAVCGATVEVADTWQWPVGVTGDNPTCGACERLTGD